MFGPDGLVDDGCAAMAFSTGVSASVAAREDAASDLREAGRASDAEALERLERDAEVVLLFIDSTRGDIADTLSGAYEAAGPSVPLAGGAAGGSAKAHFHSGRASLSTHGEVARIRGAKGDRNHAVVTVAFG